MIEYERLVEFDGPRQCPARCRPVQGNRRDTAETPPYAVEERRYRLAVDACMPLFFFDTNHGTDLVRDLMGMILADKSTAKKQAVSRIAEMTMELPGGHHEITVLVKNGSGSPIFRVALTLDCSSRTQGAAGQQITAPNAVVIVSSTSVMLN